MTTLRIPALFSLALFLKSLVLTVSAASGDLDTTFGNGGLLTVGFGGTSDYTRSSVLQGDGKLIILGTSGSQLTLVRVGTNGLADPTFGSLGKVVFAPASMPYQTPEVVRLQADGKIVVASDASSGGAYWTLVSRFNTDGTPDTTFGSGSGYVTRSLSTRSQTCQALSLLGDGRIVIAGKIYVFGIPYDEPRYFASRFLANGDWDPVLSGGAILSTNYSYINDMLVQSDNKFLFVGYDNANAVFRYNEDGSRDTSFGNNGKVVINASSSIQSVAIQQGDFTVFNPDKIVVAGSGYVAPSNTALVARMSMSGVLDTTLGGGLGYVNRYVGPNPNIKKVLALNSGISLRTIYLIGLDYPTGIPKIFLAKMNSAGTLDSTFGSGGVVSTSIGPAGEEIYDASSIAGGRLQLACAPNPDNPNVDTDYTVVRYVTATGVLDPNFGVGGILEYNVGDLPAAPKAVVIQSDGKILVTGSANGVIGLARFNSDGSYDTNFTNNGKVLAAISNYTCGANALQLLPDGRFLVGGSVNTGAKDNVLLARFMPNGSIDSTFGSAGVVITAVGTNYSTALALKLQSDGKILVGGQSALSGNSAYLVMRYLTNGTLDTSWNGSGMNLTGVGSTGDQLAGLAILTDGKIAAGGYSSFGSSSLKFSVTRYLSNGVLDNSFGSFGRLAFNVGPNNLDAALSFFNQPDGKWIMSGYGFNSTATDADIAIARLNPDGAFDSGFNGSGKLITSIGLGVDFSTCGALQADNKIIIGAATTIGSTYHFGLLRLLSNGQPDTGFGFGGRNYYDFGTLNHEQPSALAVDAANRVVMVGTVNNIFGILRVIGDNYAIQFTSIQRTNGHILLKGTGIPASAHTLQQSPALNPAAFTPLTTINTDATGNWQFEDSTFSSLTNRFYRISYP